MSRSRRAGERGSMSVEMTTLVFPVTVVMVVFLLGAWQLSLARLDVHTAAAAALADTGRACTNLDVQVDLTAFGRGGHVEVAVTCHVTTGDLTGLHAPGSAPTTATARAPIDTFIHLEGDTP